MQAEWAECLSRVSFESALETVRSIRDLGTQEPPTPGEVYLGGRQRDEGIEADRRRKIRLLDAPKPNAEEIAKVRSILGGVLEKIGRK